MACTAELHYAQRNTYRQTVTRADPTQHNQLQPKSDRKGAGTAQHGQATGKANQKQAQRIVRKTGNQTSQSHAFIHSFVLRDGGKKLSPVGSIFSDRKHCNAIYTHQPIAQNEVISSGTFMHDTRVI